VFKCRTRPALHHVELFRVIKFDALSDQDWPLCAVAWQLAMMWHKRRTAQPLVPLTSSRLPILWHHEVEP
jgi:hypothetical protein